jgi:Flp pilus assembly protein TadD
VARRAALALVKLDRTPDELAGQEAACRSELGASERAPVKWIDLRFRELDEPREAIAAWAAAIQDETKLLADKSPETEFAVVRELVQRHLDRCDELKLREETGAALAAIIELVQQQLERSRDGQRRDEPGSTLLGLARWGVDWEENDAQTAALAWAMAWIIRHERWDVLEDIEQDYEQELAASRKLLYHLAAARSRAGEAERAAQLAERAFQLTGKDDRERVKLAEAVAELGFVEWAEREYRRAIDTAFPVLHSKSVEARSDLAMWLHDREDYDGAAELLGELVEAAEADRAGKVKLIRELSEEGFNGQEVLAGAAARREFYLACHEESRGHFDKQREHLEAAAKAFDKDPDILIAMYRLQGADEEFRRQTRERIGAAAAQLQQFIDENPTDYPSLYNQWAWLVANTEGDQAKAVEYSRRSLELSPNEPSYLDTLGRCYFAVGDVENAVVYQRRAVKLAPQYRVMQRQLKQFEDALAAKSK